MTHVGKMAEWSNALDSKSSIRFYRIEGSNPSLSARTVSHLTVPTNPSGFINCSVDVLQKTPSQLLRIRIFNHLN